MHVLLSTRRVNDAGCQCVRLDFFTHAHACTSRVSAAVALHHVRVGSPDNLPHEAASAVCFQLACFACMRRIAGTVLPL